ncbi:uncharacterized protein LAJ45_08499 [Morchella importuna]|uniref:uncharacterized protein n=1 Tax=Morchella importuna TaxID=1174673 RepID=UPI001E8DF0AB|nr:uncharacterized protein LAJ45_08499 [Morchella importuna]KAH8147343.1 hypothetical protein LAJ45_08499 [Morchella importuna]
MAILQHTYVSLHESTFCKEHKTAIYSIRLLPPLSIPSSTMDRSSEFPMYRELVSYHAKLAAGLDLLRNNCLLCSVNRTEDPLGAKFISETK